MGHIRRQRYREYKEMIITLCALSWPVILEQIMQTAVIYVDSAMVGRISAEASAAVGVTATVTWMIGAPIFAAGVGVLACLSRALGAGEHEKTARISVQSILLTLVTGLVLGALSVGLSPFIPRWLGADPAIQRDASLYLGIICLPMVFRSANIIFSSVLRAAGDMRTPMRVNILVNVINVVLNFLLIYETRTVSLGALRLTLPGAGLGVTGAAVATAIAATAGGILMAAALWKNEAASPRGFRIKLDRPIMRDCVRIAVPVALQRLTVSFGMVVFSALVTSLGTISIAAHSLALNAEEAFYLPGYGFQVAASALAGFALGERNERKLDMSSRAAMLIAFVAMAISGGLLFLFPDATMSVFSRDARVIAAGASVLRLVALSEPLFGVAIILEGVFNGVGDTKTPFWISVFCMWGIRITLTTLCVKVFHLGLTAVWLCMIADNVVRCLMLGTRYVRGRWKRTLGLGEPHIAV